MIVQDLFEAPQSCPECGGISFSDMLLAEKKDACYYKVKASAKVWPSAYASGRLVQCRKKGADNYGNSKNEGVAEAERQPGRFSGAWQILVNGKKVHSFRGNFDQETADRVGVVKATSRGLYNPDSGDKIKIVPVMLNQKQGVAEGNELTEEFDLIESIIDRLAEHNGVDAELIWEDLESLTDDELYVFAVTMPLMEDWQKANKKDRTDGMSRKAVNAYRRENPGSKLKTAVTTKPSKLKKGGKASKRRKSYCSRSRGQMKMHSISCAKTPDKAICKARRRWNCESIDFNLLEMDKTQTSPGRDGDIDWTKKQIHLGPEHVIKAKDVAQHALKALDKSMKKSHADTSKKKGVAEAINPDITNPAFSHQQQIGDYLYVARYWSKGLKITAYHGAKQIGYAELMYQTAPFDDFADPKTTPKRVWLESEWTRVDPKYQRQGIMSTMYAYAKMLGNSVKPSQTRSDDAKAAWASWRQAGDAKHLTSNEGVAEGAAQDESAEDHGWMAELVDEINYNTFEVKLTNTRSRESANFVVRPVDMMRISGKLQIETMDVKDLQTGETGSWTTDMSDPKGAIVDAVGALFWDNPQLNKKLYAIVDAHSKKGQDMLPGQKNRAKVGMATPADQFIAGQDAIAKAKGTVKEFDAQGFRQRYTLYKDGYEIEKFGDMDDAIEYAEDDRRDGDDPSAVYKIVDINKQVVWDSDPYEKPSRIQLRKPEQGMAEVSRDTLKSYQQKVSADSMKHSADPTKRSQQKANRSVAGFAKAQNRLEQGVAEGDNEKIGGRYDPDEFDQMVQRLKKLAGAGPMKTVYDPQRRVYRNMPTAQQPPKQPKK